MVWLFAAAAVVLVALLLIPVPTWLKPDSWENRQGAFLQLPGLRDAVARVRRQRYCSDTCRRTACRRRHAAAQPEPAPMPAARSRRDNTVYECGECFNGHHWAQHQADRAGVACTALDNGFLAADDPKALQRICNRLSGAKIDALLRKWLAILPHHAADRRAGYRYQLSLLQTSSP